MLDPQDLRYFQAIARYESLSIAARVLRLGQPALSSAVQRLESALSATLLLRTHEGVLPTASGRALLARTEGLLALFADAVEVGRAGSEATRFVVGCNAALGEYFLPSMLRDLYGDAPEMSLRIENASSVETARAVLTGRVDLGIVVNPLPQPELVSLSLFRDAVDFFVPEDEALGVEAPLEAAWDRIRASTLIVARPVEQSVQMQELLAENRATPTRLLACEDLSLVRALCLGGAGVGLLPRRVARLASLARLHAKLPFLADTIVLLHRADLREREGAPLLLEAIAREAARQAADG